VFSAPAPKNVEIASVDVFLQDLLHLPGERTHPGVLVTAMQKVSLSNSLKLLI
jgi:hypothetical protein